jgi:hypothetical protein
MIAALLSLLGSSAVGSLIGGVFAFLNRKTDLDLKRLEFEHSLALRRADLEMVQAEAAGRLQVAVVEAEGAVESARMASIGQTQAADALDAAQIRAAGKWGWLLVISDAVRLTREQQYDAGMQAFAWVTGQASAVVGYWFVSRGSTGR